MQLKSKPIRIRIQMAASVDRPGKLSEGDRTEILQPLMDAGWKMVHNRDAIEKKFQFKDFNQAFGFMTRVALRKKFFSSNLGHRQG